MFNEAIRKVIEEKDRRIDTLENSLKSRWCLRHLYSILPNIAPC